MTRRKIDTSADHFDWFGALKKSAEEAATWRPAPLRVVVECRCGASEDRGRDLGEPVDLRGEDVVVARNDGVRPCRGCPHYIHVGRMCVQRYYSDTSAVRDYFHPECVEI